MLPAYLLLTFGLAQMLTGVHAFVEFACYPQTQPGCKKPFLKAYKNMSKSASRKVTADTKFLLYTTASPDVPERLDLCGGKLPPNSNYTSRGRFVIMLTSSYGGYCTTAIYRRIKDEFVKYDRVAVGKIGKVLVPVYDWINNPLAGPKTDNAKIVGDQILTVLLNLKDGLDGSSLYFLGHGIGAQIGSYVTKSLIENGYVPRRITALDPSNLPFSNPKLQISKESAEQVDVWHTNMGECNSKNYGLNDDPGDYNYYINGGKKQSGCSNYAMSALLQGDILTGLGGLLFPSLCAHLFAAELYRVSIKPACCQFVGFGCTDNSKANCQKGVYDKCTDDCIPMGYSLPIVFFFSDKTRPHRYYVNTSYVCDYCLSNTPEQKEKMADFAEFYDIYREHEGCKDLKNPDPGYYTGDA